MAAQTAAQTPPDRFDISEVLATRERGPMLPRLLVYGGPGAGKTTLAAGAANAVFIATEDGCSGIPGLAKIPASGTCQSWDEVMRSAQVILTAKHDFKWVVIDTLNNAYDLCTRKVCAESFKNNWANFDGYARGPVATVREFVALLNVLDQIREQRNMGVILLAHEGVAKASNAFGDDFYKCVGSIDKNTWPKVTGWADQVGHLCTEVRVQSKDGDDTGKVSKNNNNNRYLVFDGDPARDAKARVGYDMPNKILLPKEDPWGAYAAAYRAHNTKKENK